MKRRRITSNLWKWQRKEKVMITTMLVMLWFCLYLLAHVIEQQEAFEAIKVKNEKLMAELIAAENKALAQAEYADFCG